MNQPPLRNFRSNVTSRHGEDGIIAEIFKRIGAQNKWCVEFGALNGTHDSNVWTLIHGHGWSGVLIEADRTYFEKLTKAYKATPQAICLNVFISFEGENKLDSIFARTPLPKDFDLVSIDIDGNDYHVWESLVEYRPRVIVVEFNPTIPNDIVFVQPRDMAVQQGSSLLALLQLGKKKVMSLSQLLTPMLFLLTQPWYQRLACRTPPSPTFILRLIVTREYFSFSMARLCLTGTKSLCGTGCLLHTRPFRSYQQGNGCILPVSVLLLLSEV